MEKTVLLVEDNEDNRIVYATILRHHGYRVREATKILPDAILMDISIPRIDGWQATEMLKADSTTAHIPIVALTAHALSADRQKAQRVGCDGYLAKPCEPRRVVAEIVRVIGPAVAPAE